MSPRPFSDVIAQALERELERRQRLDPRAQLELRAAEEEVVESRRFELQRVYDPQKFAHHGLRAIRAATAICALIEDADRRCRR